MAEQFGSFGDDYMQASDEGGILHSSEDDTLVGGRGTTPSTPVRAATPS
jgi:hypothetical protein